MLIEFRFKNFRSFRDEAVLSMEAMGLGSHKESLIRYRSHKLLPGAAIYGKNGGGKSNVVRAFWLAVQFVRNAQRTQHEGEPVPVAPFCLNDYSQNEPTEFEFIYTFNGNKYRYSLAATREKVIREELYHSPKGQNALVFSREGQQFSFTEDKARRRLISETVASNQLFFSVASTMNDAVCVNAMRWFRDYIFFSRDYADIPQQLLNYSNDGRMLKAIEDYARAADFGIESMQFEIDRKELGADSVLPNDFPDEIRVALAQFMRALSDVSDRSESHMRMCEVKAISSHLGRTAEGKAAQYSIELADESDGTRRLMAFAPAIELALTKGGVLVIDEIEKELHPMLVEFIVAKFQNKASNPNGAQLIFTTHNTELLNMELLRKDQLYFADKNREDGASELYSISGFKTRTGENVRKEYLLGKYGAIPDVSIEEVS